MVSGNITLKNSFTHHSNDFCNFCTKTIKNKTVNLSAHRVDCVSVCRPGLLCACKVSSRVGFGLTVQLIDLRLSLLNALLPLCSNTGILIWAKPAPCQINFCNGAGLFVCLRVLACAYTCPFFKTAALNRGVVDEAAVADRVMRGALAGKPQVLQKIRYPRCKSK